MRTELISTSRLKAFKRVYYLFFISINILALGVALPLIIKGENYYLLMYLPIIWYFSARALLETKQLKTISYDDSSVYYEKDGYEVQIPFEDIKNIELYKGWAINLYRPTQDGDRIMFTPSVWYPFNFRRKDAEINVLRDKIDDYKRQLGSHYSEPLPGRRI